MLYSHKFAGGTAYATSNKVDNVLTVQEPLDETSLVKIEPNTTNPYKNWVWSNAETATFKILPTFTSNLPYSKIGIFESDATNPAAPKGSTNTIGPDDISVLNELAWSGTTGSTTDLGKASENITVYVKSTTHSAPSERRIEGKTATFVVRNAVTALSGLADKTLYAGSSAVTQSVTITPAHPYSNALILVDKDGQDLSSKSITSEGGAKVTLTGQTIEFDASKVGIGTGKQTIKFKVRSRQSNAAVDTGFITFTVNAVNNITKTIVEGETILVPAGIGTINNVEITQGSTAISASKSGENVSITGLAVDSDTSWSITVTNAAGAHITVSGTTTHLTDVSTSINTGDYIIVGQNILAGIGDSITEIITKLQPNQGKASIANGWLKYEASTTNGPIAAGKYAIKVKGANGATRTVNINVSNITATLN